MATYNRNNVFTRLKEAEELIKEAEMNKGHNEKIFEKATPIPDTKSREFLEQTTDIGGAGL